MKFVFESAALCEGLVAPVARCFAAALDELGLEPVVEADPEPELARAMPAERLPLVESGRERELEARDDAAGSSGSKAASVEGREESIGPSRTARRESGEVARLRLRPREPERSRVESIGGREHDSSLEREGSSEREQHDSSRERESRIARAHVRAPRDAELDSTMRSSVGESATHSTRAGFDAARVAELLAKRIEGTPSTTGRLRVQPRASADASISSSSSSEESMELAPPIRELANPNLAAESPAALPGLERGTSDSTIRRVDASEPATVRPPAPSHAGEASTSPERASLRTSSADETPRTVETRSQPRLRVRPRPRIDAHELARGSSPEPNESASVERRDSIEAPATSMLPSPPWGAPRAVENHEPTRFARGASERPQSGRPRLTPPMAAGGLSSPTSTTRLHAGRISVVARGSEALALNESEVVDASTPELARRDEAIASTSTREWPSSLRATHPRTLELAGSPGSARPNGESASPLASIPTHPALATASPSGSATTRESSFAPPSTTLVADPIDGELERTLTAVLRNAARRHGIDV